jgi:predicted amidohydrolase
MGEETARSREGDAASLKVALCQVLTEPWETEANLGRALAGLQVAAERGAELAIMPECVLHGYAFEQEGDPRRVLDVAEPLDSSTIARLREAVRDLAMDVVFGFAEREGERVFNSAAFISRAGEVLDVYRKVHCRDFEDVTRDGWFTPGDRFFALDRAYGQRTFRIGTIICFDREVTESVRCLRALGAQVVACPLACDTRSVLQYHARAENEMITRARAAENEVFIVVVNHAGRCNGGSFAVGPQGEVLHQMDAEPGIVVLDVPVGVVAERFHSRPLGWMGWGFRRPEVYARYLSD